MVLEQNLPGHTHPPTPRGWRVTRPGRRCPPPPLPKRCVPGHPHAGPTGRLPEPTPAGQRSHRPSVCSPDPRIWRPKQGLVRGAGGLGLVQSTGLAGHICPTGGSPGPRAHSERLPPSPSLGRGAQHCQRAGPLPSPLPPQGSGAQTTVHSRHSPAPVGLARLQALSPPQASPSAGDEGSEGQTLGTGLALVVWGPWRHGGGSPGHTSMRVTAAHSGADHRPRAGCGGREGGREGEGSKSIRHFLRNTRCCAGPSLPSLPAPRTSGTPRRLRTVFRGRRHPSPWNSASLFSLLCSNGPDRSALRGRKAILLCQFVAEFVACKSLSEA